MHLLMHLLMYLLLYLFMHLLICLLVLSVSKMHRMISDSDRYLDNNDNDIFTYTLPITSGITFVLKISSEIVD